MIDETRSFAQLLIENRKILQKFADQGTDLGKTREIECCVGLNGTAACKDVRRIFRERYQVPAGGLFIVVDDPSDFRLMLLVEMMPAAETISEIEEKLRSASEGFDGAEVFWEFHA